MNPLPYALTLAERGIPSFPCLASKAPACPGGFKAATADTAALTALWRRWPGVLIGVPTGPASGLDALDIDPRHGGDAWEREHADRLPPTRVHATRSGGRHYLFRHREGVRNSASLIAPGVDVRGEGGFVVWWPAVGCAVTRARIAAWPDWLLKVLPPPPVLDARPAPPQWAGQPLSETVAERMIRGALYRVETAPAGERHVRLRAAARTIGGLCGPFGIGEGEAGRALLDAVKRAGGDGVNDANARGTIAWGLAAGAAAPLSMGGRDARR